MSESLLEMDWELPPGVHAAFTTRIGGVSTAPWDSFNVATHVGDDLAHVGANRARLTELLALPASPSWLEPGAWHRRARMRTAQSARRSVYRGCADHFAAGEVCVVMVADCLPVLFATRDGRRIGAAHAGWRGLAAGVLERTVSVLGVPAQRTHSLARPGDLARTFRGGR